MPECMNADVVNLVVVEGELGEGGETDQQLPVNLLFTLTHIKRTVGEIHSGVRLGSEGNIEHLFRLSQMIVAPLCYLNPH